jgi:hypothetical protein
MKCFEISLIFSWIATMTQQENCNENLRRSISGIFGDKFMGTDCNALVSNAILNENIDQCEMWP